MLAHRYGPGAIAAILLNDEEIPFDFTTGKA